MHPRFSQFPASLSQRSRLVRFGNIPALLVHPDWKTPAPFVLWLHGRTASKEIDPGRYLRWARAGIAACAIDLPGHGERADASLQTPRAAMDVLTAMLPEIDLVIDALADKAREGLFDLDRSALGGMSLGGMATLRRLCDGHDFRCAAVESTTGWLGGLYSGEPAPGTPALPSHGTHASTSVPDSTVLDPSRHLEKLRPIPLLALHSEADLVVPFSLQNVFINMLRRHYASLGADPMLITFRTWPTTGAGDEHSGFGKVSYEAKTIQTDFLARFLNAVAPEPERASAP